MGQRRRASRHAGPRPERRRRADTGDVLSVQHDRPRPRSLRRQCRSRELTRRFRLRNRLQEWPASTFVFGSAVMRLVIVGLALILTSCTDAPSSAEAQEKKAAPAPARTAEVTE